jgi:hypothetical protein
MVTRKGEPVIQRKLSWKFMLVTLGDFRVKSNLKKMRILKEMSYVKSVFSWSVLS